MKMLHGLSALPIVGGFLFSTHIASAGSVIWTPPSSCTTLNCDATILYGNITSSSNGGGSVEPFVLQLHSSSQYCLRLDVINQEEASGGPADLEMVLVAPNGTVWRNNNRSATDTRPLIVVPSGIQGWYTLHISTANGVAALPGSHYNVDLAYGRYTSTTNPNCSHPTAPMLAGPGNS